MESSGTTLTELSGIGILNAARSWPASAMIQRFRSADAFASYTGTAPIAVSSGDVCAIAFPAPGTANSTAACTPWRSPSSAATFQAGPTTDARAAGKSHKEALRCLKRRLSNVVYRQLVRDADTLTGAGPAGHTGATPTSSAAGSHPITSTSDKSLTGPATLYLTTATAPLDTERRRLGSVGLAGQRLAVVENSRAAPGP